LTVIEPNGSVIPVECGRDGSRPLWLLCSFQGPPEAYARPCGDGIAQARGRRPSAGLSKLNSMPATAARAQEDADRGCRPARFGRRARPAGRSSSPGWEAGPGGAPLRRSLERR